jgi:hypothetical protein
MQERGRRQQPGGRVSPPKERLGAQQGTVRKANLRLVKNLELTPLVGSTKLEILSAFLVRPLAQGRHEHPAAMAAVRLCLIERKIGIGEEVTGLLAECRVDGETDAGANVDRPSLENEGFGNGRYDPVSNYRSLHRIPDARKKHNELVSADPGHGIDRSAASQESPRDGHK